MRPPEGLKPIRLFTASGKNRTPLGFARRLRIRRRSALTPSVRPRSRGGGPKSHHGTTDYLPPDPDRNWNAHRTDGTTNFVHGFPYACISLGLIDQRVPVLGVIYNPFLEHLYTGVRGAGSFLRTRCSPNATTDDNINDATLQRLPLSPASGRPLSSLAGALVAVEWGSDRAREPIQRKADSFSRLAGAPPHGVMTHSLRSVGSAALNFALVAQGALDMYWCVLTRDRRRRFRSFHFWGRSTSHLYFFFSSLVRCREIGCWCVSFRTLSLVLSVLRVIRFRTTRKALGCLRASLSLT